ncbi:MAG TPA: OmpH family outer membrane protein [Phycisphaerales bacterium]|nr:OmpH family outer membrane protein [Phycisphaerales bacterium]
MSRNRLHSALLGAACLSVVALVGWRAGAEATETRFAAQPTTVAVVDMMRALNELEELQVLNAPLVERGTERQADLDTLRKQMESLDAQLKALPESDLEGRRRLRAQLYELRETATARASVYQSLINIEKGEVIRPLYIKFVEAVKEVATKQGYDLVIFDDRAMEVPQGTEADVNRAIERKRILYAADRLDITSEVVLLMNEKYKAGVN